MQFERLSAQKSPQDVALEALKLHFPHCFDKDGAFLLERFVEELGRSGARIGQESYRLEWLGKSYAKALAHEPPRALLAPMQKDRPPSPNALIKGDNLEVLKLLANAYEGAVKMIYIDPPYNTGNDGFLYSDRRRYTPEELARLASIGEEEAKRVLEYVSAKSSSHSAWLTFLYPRLYVARRLLRDDGVIFVSIDDNEAAQLRLMMDEIFGEEHFVAQLVWRKKAGGGNDSAQIAVEHEYILVYRKKDPVAFKLPLKEETLKSYKYRDERYDLLGPYKLKDLNDPSLSDSKGLHYDIECPDGTILRADEHQWKCNYDTFRKRLAEGRIVFRRNKKGEWKVYYKIYLHEEKGEVRRDREGNVVVRGRKPQSILYDVAYNKDGSQDIKALFGDAQIFRYPKPRKLIEHLIRMCDFRDGIVLDFFAGSGTTGEAVMRLNAEDGGSRRFLLVQLDEPIDPKKNAAAYRFAKEELGAAEPTIFEITKERLVRAKRRIEKELEEEIEKLEGELAAQGRKDGAQLQRRLEDAKERLAAFRKDSIGFYETQRLPDEFFSQEFAEELALPQSLDPEALLLTWRLYDGSRLDEPVEEVDLEGYRAYLADGRLYLLHEGFATRHVAALLRRIDEDGDFAPTKVVASGYALDTKAQRELYEALQHFVAKKGIELQMVVRY